MPLSPVLAGQSTYPFVRLEEAKRRKAEEGVRILDFGMGDPKGVPEEPIRKALVGALEEAAGYPAAQGLPELREAIARWLERRFDVEIDPDVEVIPTLGSKEAIFSFAQIAVDAAAGKDVVVVPDPAYPVYERGALFAGATVRTLPLAAASGFLPDLDAVEPETWERAAVVWVNYPNNPTTASAPLSFFERLAELARAHDFYLASDEAYSELWFEQAPASALEAGTENIVAFNTLSKRSSMTGYRSGFVAGDERAIDALRKFRPTVGTAPQLFVQRASVIAWDDEEHVERTRERYRRKREVFLELFRRKGVRVEGSAATMYLWARVPDGETSEAFAERLLDHGVVVAPGSYLGAPRRGLLPARARPVRGGVPGRRRDPRARAVTPPLEARIEAAWETAGPEALEPVDETIRALDEGRLRVAEKHGDEWVVHEWVKKAILLYFRLHRMEPAEAGPFTYVDKVPLKRFGADSRVRVVPPAVARYGSFLSDDVILMPSYVNIGAWVGPRTMVDTWATVGSCAQIGADVHLAGGVGIGGVLEPVQARPVIVEDGAFLGSRCIVTEGVVIGEEAVLAPNVSLTATVPVLDVTGAEVVEHRGYVPPRSVVVPGTRAREFAAGTFQVACALIIGRRSESTDRRVSLNDALRQYGIAG